MLNSPECMGAVCAVIYLLVVIVFIPFPFYKDIVAATSGGGNRDTVVQIDQIETGRLLHKFPHSKLASYLSAILSLQAVVLLGVGDDLFDIRWRHKILIPAFAAIPLLIVYFVDFGVTHIVLPTLLRPYYKQLVDLGKLMYNSHRTHAFAVANADMFTKGWMYYVYMAAIAIFCPNSINIVAGVNGLEVGQSVVIAMLIVLNDAFYLSPFIPYPHPATDSHLFSLYFLLPFLGVSTALLAHNWYPAKVFVGDTYCYFAGMIFAIVGILGHFSKTLLLLFIPQLVNFIYSAPQLFHIIPCPRHRLPRFNARTGLLEPSYATIQRPLYWPVVPILKVLNILHLLDLRLEKETGEVREVTNLTVLNLWLIWFGPMREDKLTMGILAAQTACGLLGLFTRHHLALYVFTEDNV